MFIGRERELSRLNQLYNSGKFQCPVIYGRRRVGKTALINEFVKDKDVIFFTGIESNALQNLENLSRSIFIYENGMDSAPVFQSFQTALEYVFRLAEQKRIILVMDEYPYAAKSFKALSSILQVLIDKNKDTSKLFLIMCGSSMSFMEEQVLGYESPLYGRRTAQFKVEPFNFSEVCQYFPNFSFQDIAELYGIVGGTPQYLLQMNPQFSIQENLCTNLLDTSSYLFEEPNNLLKQEVREASLYNAIITSIANGCTKLSEIAGKVGEESSSCAAYLKKLISLGLIDKEVPFGEKTTKKTIYVINDNLFRFWYRFIPTNMSILQNGMIELAYRRISEQMNTYMGPVFEEICKQYLWELNRKGLAAITFIDLGRWWGSDPKTKKQEEIDIIAAADKDTAIFGECKWTNTKIDTAVLDKLIERSNLFSYKNKHFYLFSRTGFSQGCIDKSSAMSNVTLVTYEEMLHMISHNQPNMDTI